MASRRLSTLLSRSLSFPSASAFLGWKYGVERGIQRLSTAAEVEELVSPGVEVKYTQHIINGKFVDSASGKTFPTLDPRTEEVITHVAEGEAEDINRAVAAARKAFDEGPWPKMSAYERSRIMLKFADLLEKHTDELATLETWDNGKPYEQAAKSELPMIVRLFHYYAGWADKIHGLTVPADGPHHVQTLHEPIGVAGQIIPWNFPLAMFAWKVGPALATGNTVVLKTAEQTPLTALYAGKLFHEAGLPPGVLNIVSGYGPTAGAALASHMEVDKLAFTGSTDTGKIVLELAAKSNLKPVTLELGGKSPFIICDDANIDRAVEDAHFALFFNQGQCCCAGSRTYVHERIYDEFVEKAKARAMRRVVGDPFKKGVEQGPQVLGAVWYLMSVERHFSCWKMECKKQGKKCNALFLDCSYITMHRRRGWARSTKVFKHCNAKTTPNGFEFGMFADAYNDQVASASFYERYFYCLWWGLRSLSSYGQGMDTTTNTVETLFSSLICLMGLVIFALLIGNMQSYLQSMSTRLEEWRIKRRDTEEWMSHRQLPQDLQERVRRFVQYKWLATRGVEEEEILRSLPLDIRREIQRHLCLALVRRVPFFSQMDDQLLDAICERLVSSLNTKDTFIVREGDPVNEMLFIIRGQLESSTTNGGRSGFFNSITLKPGDFCGEELLTWALMPNVNVNLPSSTRTVKSLMEVEAFALRAEDLKFVANQFRRLHSKKLQHAFRYYSHQWRTWGACFMQAAWRRYKRKKLAEELARQESMSYMQYTEENEFGEGEEEGGDPAATDTNAQHLSATILASKFAANTRKGAAGHGQKVRVDPAADPSLRMPKLFKPNEPDFSADRKPTRPGDDFELD